MPRNRYAIIDIGSNAIRASIYDGNQLGSPEIYNDKFKSDIIGLLDLPNLDVKHHTYITFQHFIHVFDKLKVSNIRGIATAVLRGHPNAQLFVDLIKSKYNINIEVITGEEEARLGALGVTMAINNTCGVVTDFGGGSLELCKVHDNEISNLISLPIGSKIILKRKSITVEEIIQLISENNSLPSNQNLYFIGGALRLIGRLYMSYIKYPINNLHNLEISKYAMQTYLDKIEDTLNRQQFCSNYTNLVNIENLPIAIKLSRALIKIFNPEKIIISNYGLKEGVRLAELSDEEQRKNFVYERCKRLYQSSITSESSTFDITAYKKIILLLIPNINDAWLEVIKLALILCNGFKNVDKSQRASYFSEMILATDIPFTHKIRVKLALILAYSYRSKNDLKIHKLSKKIISFEEFHIAQIIGNILRIVRHIDGPELSSPSFTFNLKGAFIEIVSENILPKPIFNKVCGHLKDIGYARKKTLFQNYQFGDDD